MENLVALLQTQICDTWKVKSAVDRVAQNEHKNKDAYYL